MEMRLGRIIIGGFISKYGFQLELGVWIKSHYWLCLLLKALFGYAFFGLSGVEGGAVSYGIERSGPRWKFKWSKRDKEKEKYIKKMVLSVYSNRKKRKTSKSLSTC